MSALGIAGSLAGTAVKTAVNRSINQYQERRLDQQSKVDWCVRAIPDRRWGPPLGTRGSRALTTTTADGVSVFRRHADASATTNPRRAPAGVLPPARRFSRKCAKKALRPSHEAHHHHGFDIIVFRVVARLPRSKLFPFLAFCRREDYNYPPYLNVLHYNSDDIENVSARAAVRLAHVSYLYTLSLFLLNFLGTIILAGGGAVDAVNVVYTLFNVIIYAIVGMYAFYCGYKGMATRNGRLTDYYVWLQSFFCVFQLIASSVNGANYYGWSNAKRARRSEKMADFFLGWTFFESTMWTLGYLLGAAALYRVVTTRKDAMRSQGASGYGLRV